MVERLPAEPERCLDCSFQLELFVEVESIACAARYRSERSLAESRASKQLRQLADC